VILVVDDDAPIRRMLSRTLAAEGYAVEASPDGGDALASVERSTPDLVVLDLSMPGLDGLSVARRLRDKGLGLPILMLTARDAVPDRVAGLDSGADDYLTKPFSLAELLARVKALLRRASLLAAAQASAHAQSQQPKAIRNGELEILPAKRQVTWRGKSIDFTALEFDLLLHFASHPGHVFSRSQLLNAVWGYTHDGYEHTVTTHINRLRGKLEADPMRPELILTARGAGYKMRDAP
jgi:DNA-binding response OmpR family regulator